MSRSPSLRRFVFVLLAALVVATSLSACGRRGAIEPPADADPAYPRTYPAPATSR